MKRDMDLIRELLIYIEDHSDGLPLYDLQLEEHGIVEVAYHSRLLYEANLVSSYDQQEAEDEIIFFSVGPLTWDGHEFLEKIRQETIWNKTKEVVTKKGLPMLFDIIKNISETLISSAVEGAIKGLKQS